MPSVVGLIIKSLQVSLFSLLTPSALIMMAPLTYPLTNGMRFNGFLSHFVTQYKVNNKNRCYEAKIGIYIL